MKTKEQIMEELELIPQIYKDEKLPEYIRGAYAALKWVLEDTKEETK